MGANILFSKLASTTYRNIFSMQFLSRTSVRRLRPWMQGAESTITNFLKSISSLSMSSLDNLLLSCLYRGEKRAFLSSVPEASLNKGLQEEKGELGTGPVACTSLFDFCQTANCNDCLAFLQKEWCSIINQHSIDGWCLNIHIKLFMNHFEKRKSTLLPRQKASCTGPTGHMPVWHFSGPSVPPSGKQEHTVTWASTQTHNITEH